MDKVHECYRESLSLLMPGAEIVMVGTRWHVGELYGRILAKDLTEHRWQTFIRDGEVGPDGTSFPYAAIGLTKEFLAIQKSEQGTKLYSCLYRMSPQDDETATFKTTHFSFYQPVHNEAYDRWLASLYITCVLDPIPPPMHDHGDDAALTVVGTDAHHTMYLLDAVSRRMTPDQQIEEALSLHAKWNFRKFGLETNAFQRMVKSTLENRLNELRDTPNWQPFSIIEFTGLTQGNKELRIQGLQPWHERGLLKFPGERLELLTGVWSQLAYQMIEFTHSQKDDLLDSLAYHLQLKQAGFDRPQAVEYPVTSAAWYEREVWHKQELQRWSRTPRWHRPAMPEMVFS
jgi:predicted phage terminase large subunit-like protein